MLLRLSLNTFPIAFLPERDSVVGIILSDIMSVRLIPWEKYPYNNQSDQ